MKRMRIMRKMTMLRFILAVCVCGGPASDVERGG
jgi:hypothetical protein